MADSYVASASREASSVAELAASKKMDKYTGLATVYIISSRLRSRCSVRSMGRPLIFFLLWRRRSANVLATSGRRPFYSSAFLCWCSVIIAFYCTSRSSTRTARSNGHSNIFISLNFFQNPSGSLIPRVKIIIIIIIIKAANTTSSHTHWKRVNTRTSKTQKLKHSHLCAINYKLRNHCVIGHKLYSSENECLFFSKSVWIATFRMIWVEYWTTST